MIYQIKKSFKVELLDHRTKEDQDPWDYFELTTKFSIHESQRGTADPANLELLKNLVNQAVEAIDEKKLWKEELFSRRSLTWGDLVQFLYNKLELLLDRRGLTLDEILIEKDDGTAIGLHSK